MPAFTWLPLTTLSASRYADQHFLFHLLLIPFTWIADLRLGAKLGAVFFSSLAVYSLYWLTLRYRIRYSMIWLLGLLGCSWLFLARLSMTKAQGLSILFMVAGIVLLFERKYAWLGITAFFYVWTYNLFVMLGILAVIWVAVLWWSERRFEWRPLAWTAGGTALGFLVSPYFPNNFRLFLEHVAAKSGSATLQSRVGFEWLSLPGWDFLTSSVVACAAMVAGYIALGYAFSLYQSDRVKLQRPLLFFFFSSFLMLITIRANRFMEYWPPFAVLFVAFTMQAVWEKVPTPGVSPDQKPHWKLLAPIAALLVVALIYNLRSTRTQITGVTRDADHYRAGAEWLRTNLPPGTLIFDVNWTDFPKLFFYAPEMTYVSGLDPLYLLDQHPELARLNDRLSTREEPDPAGAIRSLFAATVPSGVSYVFVGDDPGPPPPVWFRYILQSGRFKELYHDTQCVIFQVLDQAMEPTPAPSASVPAPPAPAAPPLDDAPHQRSLIAAQVNQRFKGDIFGTVDENYVGQPNAPVAKGPALIVMNKDATSDWAQKILNHDMEGVTNEFLWQLGFRYYVITNNKQYWAISVTGNPKYRHLFKSRPPAKQ
jgi:hypothetical protein